MNSNASTADLTVRVLGGLAWLTAAVVAGGIIWTVIA